jgi:hypothetical protein
MEHELFDVTVHSTGQYYNGAVARGGWLFLLARIRDSDGQNS